MSKPSILLVESDYPTAKIYSEGLRSGGYKVRVSDNAQGAIYCVDESTPDLIILEIQQIKHNGYEFLYELRSYVDWQYIPVIINSFIPRHALGLDDVLMSELGISAVLYKPTTSLSKLIYTVESTLVTVTK